jgi:hypothetical protein
MPWRFFDCRKRIERANYHREAIAQLWNKVCNMDSYAPLLNMNDDGTGSIRVRPVYDTQTMDEIRFHLGEFLYQLRAALDGCVYQSAIIDSGCNPPPNESTLEFPICTKGREFKSKRNRAKIAPLAQERRNIIEEVQPYRTPKVAPEELVREASRSLGILNDWARKDRHRTLHVVGSWPSNAEPLFDVEPGLKVRNVKVKSGAILEEEEEIATFRVVGYRRGMKVRANPNCSIDIAVDEEPRPCADNDIFGLRMFAMSKTCEVIIEWFEKSFEVHSPLVKRGASAKNGLIIQIWQKLKRIPARLRGLISRS